MSGESPNQAPRTESNPFDEPRSPALRRLMFSVGAWITAATLTAIGSLSTTILDDSPVMTWLVSQFAPGVVALLTIGLGFSLVVGWVRLRNYREQQRDAIDPIGPPPPASSLWRPDPDVLPEFANGELDEALKNPAFGIDTERIHRIDVRGVRSVDDDADPLWWDTADRILMALDLPGGGLSAGSNDCGEQSEIAKRCAEALGGNALLVLDQEPDADKRTEWLRQVFTDVRTADPEAPGSGPYLLVWSAGERESGEWTEPAADRLLLQAFASLPVDVLDTEGLTALNNEIAVFLESAERTDNPRQSDQEDIAQRSKQSDAPQRLEQQKKDGSKPEEFRYSPTRALHTARKHCGLDGPASDYRFQMAEELRKKLLDEWKEHQQEPPSAADQAVRASTSWVLRHYAMLSTAWCRDLGIPDRAPVAARWFRTNEPLLRALVRHPYGREFDAPEKKREPAENQDATQHEATEPERRALEQQRVTQIWLVLEDLTAIADALDVWYRREHQARLARLVAEKLGEHAELLEHPTLRELATLRMAAAKRALVDTSEQSTPAKKNERGPGTPFHRLLTVGRPPRRLRAALNARRHHDRAMTLLQDLERTKSRSSQQQVQASSGDAAGPVPDPPRELENIEEKLRDAWLWLPRKDLVGAVTILINLSIVHLRQGRLQPARDRLELAESLAIAANDASAHARALELRGVVSWSEGHGSEAMRQWEQARQEYRTLGELYGEGRCCQHLGSAAVHSPAMAAIGLSEFEVSREQAVSYAERMLTTARRALGDHEGRLAKTALTKLRGEHDSRDDPRTEQAEAEPGEAEKTGTDQIEAEQAEADPVIEQVPAEQLGSTRSTRHADPDPAPSIERILRDIRKLIRQWRKNLPRP